MKTLLAFSGGLDSTHLIDRILRETDDILDVFRIDFSETKNIDDRDSEVPPEKFKNHMKAEEICTEKILAWFASNRRPINSFHTHKLEQYEHGLWNTPQAIRYGASLMHQGYDRLMTGRAAENFSSNRGQLASNLYNEIFNETAARGKLEFPLLERKLGRAHAVEFMNPELVDLTMRCFHPTIKGSDVEYCGECRNCLMVKDAREMINRSVPADVVLDIHLRKKGAGQYSMNNPVLDRRYQGGHTSSYMRISPYYTPKE